MGIITGVTDIDSVGTAALIVNRQGEYLLHLRDDLPHVLQAGR